MIELSFPEPYDLAHTFECGQIFRFVSVEGHPGYIGSHEDRVLKITPVDAHHLRIESNIDRGLETLAKRFFRVGDDYLTMQKTVAIDPLMQKIVETTNGQHLLRQDLFECAVSYLLSQCSNIPRIKQCLNKLANRFGDEVEFEHKSYCLFPRRDQVAHLSEDDYKALGFGYRSKYLANFISKYPGLLDNLPDEPEALNKGLREIYGIGPKVADCIQLFGFGDLRMFPVDTWMEKFMIGHYCGGKKTPLQKLRALGRELFRNWAGYAQELIFHYARCYDPTL